MGMSGKRKQREEEFSLHKRRTEEKSSSKLPVEDLNEVLFDFHTDPELKRQRQNFSDEEEAQEETLTNTNDPKNDDDFFYDLVKQINAQFLQKSVVRKVVFLGKESFPSVNSNDCYVFLDSLARNREQAEKIPDDLTIKNKILIFKIFIGESDIEYRFIYDERQSRCRPIGLKSKYHCERRIDLQYATPSNETSAITWDLFLRRETIKNHSAHVSVLRFLQKKLNTKVVFKKIKCANKEKNLGSSHSYSLSTISLPQPFSVINNAEQPKEEIKRQQNLTYLNLLFNHPVPSSSSSSSSSNDLPQHDKNNNNFGR